MSGRLIVHLAPFLQGGAGRVISSLAAAQRRAGDRVLVATSLTGEPGFEHYPEYLAAIRECGAELVTVDSLFKRDRALNELALASIARQLNGDRPAVAHAHAAIPAEIGLKLDAPVVQTMHGWSRNKAAAHVDQDLSIMSRVDLVVFPSQASHDELVAIGGRFRRTAVIPNGIRADVLPAALTAFDDLRALKAEGTRLIVTIGSLTTQKNHRVLVDALPDIVTHHNAVVVLVGEGPERTALGERASALGVAERVKLLGYLEQASAILDVADLLVQPSLTESFGLAVIEAYQAGVPVIASNIPALSGLVAGAQCGWMFDPASPQDLSRAVNAAFAASPDDRAAVVDRARRYFNEHFTIDRMIDRYDAAYATVG